VPTARRLSQTLGRYMLIRRIQSHELNSLLDLYAHLHVEDDPRPKQEVIEAVWQEALANPRCGYFGAYEHGRLISSCTILVIPNLTRACRPYGIIENVVTHSEFRNQGHGKAVLAHALEFAWSERCYKVMLLTGRKDEATMRFYEGAGFDRNGKQAFVAKPAA